jgi:hypothetical protein
MIEKGTTKPPIGHELVQLFNQISAPRQALIRKTHQDGINSVPANAAMAAAFAPIADTKQFFDFDRVLQDANKAFVGWRYLYEDPTRFHGSGAKNIRLATREVILEIHPDWRAALENLRV